MTRCAGNGLDASPNSSAAAVKLRIELGRQWLAADDVARLTPGSVIELRSASDGAVDVYAAGRPAARGRLVAIDGRLGVHVETLASDRKT
ncbi:MAG: FliM/FliN family flagellar motor switch protein [Phycisphaerae bacterium]